MHVKRAKFCDACKAQTKALCVGPLSSLRSSPSAHGAPWARWSWPHPASQLVSRFTMPQARVSPRHKAPPRAGKAPEEAEGRFSLRERPAERPCNFLNRDASPSPSVHSALQCLGMKTGGRPRFVFCLNCAPASEGGKKTVFGVTLGPTRTQSQKSNFGPV